MPLQKLSDLSSSNALIVNPMLGGVRSVVSLIAGLAEFCRLEGKLAEAL